MFHKQLWQEPKETKPLFPSVQCSLTESSSMTKSQDTWYRILWGWPWKKKSKEFHPHPPPTIFSISFKSCMLYSGRYCVQRKKYHLPFRQEFEIGQDWCLWPNTIFRGSYNDVSAFLNKGVNVGEINKYTSKLHPEEIGIPPAANAPKFSIP